MRKYNGFEMLEIVDAARQVVYRTRPWHKREQLASDLMYHGAVHAALSVCRPADWHLLLLEWPHIADDDKRQIAYTRDERKGEEADVTICTYEVLARICACERRLTSPATR